VQRGENPEMINTNIDEDWWQQNPDRARPDMKLKT